MNTIAIIPCYNVANTIRDVVCKTKLNVNRVLAIDNASTDNTGVEASRAGATVFLSHRKGMGITTRTGMQNALQFHPKADIIVTLDGDGQHNPDDISRLIKPTEACNADIVLGVRIHNHSMPTYRRIGNNIISWAHFVGTKQRMVDIQCGLRAFSRKAIEELLPILKSDGFGFTVEVLSKARKLNLSIAYIPVFCIYHNNFKHNSTMNPLLHGISVLLSTIRWRLWENRKH